MKYKLICGDSLKELKKLKDNSIDSVVTDPPYHLTSIVERFSKSNSAPAKDKDGLFKRHSKGFMGQTWDGGDIAQNVELWQEVLRVLKCGGHLIAFSHSRTYHRMTVAIEDAGFEIRDQIMWIYGSGFPKSLNISKQIDKTLGKEPIKGEIMSNWINKDGSITKRNLENHNSGNQHSYGFKDAPRETMPNSKEAKQWDGWGTALKPAHEPIVLARKPLSEKSVTENVLKNGVGAINIDECRINTKDENLDNVKAIGSMPSNKVDGKGYSRPWMQDKNKILEKQNIAIEKLKDMGRFPANVMHDDSDEVINLFPNTTSGYVDSSQKSFNKKRNDHTVGVQKQFTSRESIIKEIDTGSASRFFYGTKCNERDRNEGLEKSPISTGHLKAGEVLQEYREFEAKKMHVGNLGMGVVKGDDVKPKYNNHPTVKPTDLMAYLVKLITPKGGIVLDPFNGSGSTGKACAFLNKTLNKDYEYIGIDLSHEFIDISRARIEYTIHNTIWLQNPNESKINKNINTDQMSIFDLIGGKDEKTN